MTKKSKSRSKVTTDNAAAVESKEDSANGAGSEVYLGDPAANGAYPTSTASSNIRNGKLSSGNNNISRFGFGSTNHNFPSSTGPSLASIPKIVDDFLAPKFVKVLNIGESSYQKPPPSLEEYKRGKANSKANKVVESNGNKVPSSSNSQGDPLPPNKKNKRKKSKPVKNAGASIGTGYDSEDGQELDVLNSVGGSGSSYNGHGGYPYSDSFQRHPSGLLTSKDVSSLAQLQRIRNSSLKYEGNNIVIVSNSDNEGAQYPNTSCYDDYNYDYDADELGASGTGTGSASAPSEETSTLGIDQDDDDDEEERVGSWSLSHNHSDYNYSSQIQASSSIASSESSENNTACSLSTTTSSSSVYGSRGGYPPLTACQTIWDGVNNVCEVKDCALPATKKCSQCKGAFYCSEDHQRYDWKKHKNECIPYRMESFADDISVAVAARNIPQGQTIFSEKPLLVFAIADFDNDFLNVMDLPCIAKITKKQHSKKTRTTDSCCAILKPACLGCLKTVEFIGPPRHSCVTCRLPLCSYRCYMDPFHQASECQVVANQGGWTEDQHSCYHSLYMDIEIIRALQLEGRDPSAWERFQELKQNVRVEFYKSSEKYRRFMEHYRELVPISAKMSGYHDDLIGNVHAIITALSFRPALKSAYKLLFATQILFAHDCIPNTFHYLEEGANGKPNLMTLVTKAAQPIFRKDMITIDFCPTPYLYYPLRRMLLRNVLSIENCACKRCQKPSEIGDHTIDVKCPRCRDVICPERPTLWENSVWSCKGCLEDFPYAMIKNLTRDCREDLAVILNQPKPHTIPGLIRFIEQKQDQSLDSGHTIILQAWSFLEVQLRSSLTAKRLPGPANTYPENVIEDYRTLRRCCEAIENHLNVVRPGICYERGFMHLNRYYVELAVAAKQFDLRITKRSEYIKQLMQCMKSLQEALKIFQMFEGCSREVSSHVQEATSQLVTTKNFIQQQIISDNDETKIKKANATAAALNYMT